MAALEVTEVWEGQQMVGSVGVGVGVIATPLVEAREAILAVAVALMQETVRVVVAVDHM
jgi:hypothetical protein